MQENINSIVRVFPDHVKNIEYLFLNDESFRDICTDYILCASRILELKTELEKDLEKIEEYEELQRQLEDEILKLIIANSNNSEII